MTDLVSDNIKKAKESYNEITIGIVLCDNLQVLLKEVEEAINHVDYSINLIKAVGVKHSGLDSLK